MEALTICIDVGGTFVDLAIYDGSGTLAGTHKVLNRPGRPEEAVLQGVDQALATINRGYADVTDAIYSTTLAINAIIERRGATTALLCTDGFRDALEVRQELPYDLYNPFAAFPEPLVRRSRRLGVQERMRADGTAQQAPKRSQVVDLAARLRAEGVESVAVCLLNSYANAAHEQAVGSWLAHELPGIPLSLSSDVLPEIGEYGRTSTTVTNAYLLDVVGAHLRRLHEGLQSRGFAGRLRAVTSAGGVIDKVSAAQFPVKLLESGPAAGSVGIAAAIRGDLVTFDMGGTTAKTSFVHDGEPHRSSEYEAGRIERFRRGSGLLVRVPTIDIVEIGAGGGSIARLDRTGALRVGPESAGALPGPACYGRGGSMPTVTDADLVLGYLNPGYFLGGAMRLDDAQAQSALEREVAVPLKIDTTDAALAVFQVVNAQMSQALAVHAAERGINLHRLDMVAFGGAGPVHAFAVAEELGIRRVVVPADAGVLSAVGCRAVPGGFDAVATYRTLLDGADFDRLNAVVRQLRDTTAGHARAGRDDGEVEFEHAVDIEYCGQRSALTVTFPCGERIDAVALDAARIAFERAYLQRYGRTVPDVPCEAVTWRVRASVRAPGVTGATRRPSRPASEHATFTERPVVFPRDGRVSARVYQRTALSIGAKLEGPAIIEDVATTVVVPPHAQCVVRADGALEIDLADRISRVGEAGNAHSAVAMTHAAMLNVYWGKLVSIAEESSTALVRTAFSRIVTEARDYSCVLCDAKGELIAQSLQALPEFVNSLAEAVRHFLIAHPPATLNDGDMLLSNDPLICTSQMNDFVMVQPIFHHGVIVAYAANVAHSPDVGGRLLSAEAREIFEEGLRMPVCKFLDKGVPSQLLISIFRANSRVPDVMIGDLMAQVGANRVSEKLLIEFLEREGLDDIAELATAIKDRAEQAVREAILQVPSGSYSGSVTMDGLDRPLTIACTVHVRHDVQEVSVDYAGTSPQTEGSLNCYLNYIAAETVFALLTVLQPGTHINGGSLRPFRVTAPSGCVVNADRKAAVGARSLVVQFVEAAIYNALADVVPERVLAEPAAPVWPILVSGEKVHGGRFVEMILLNGGLGARPHGDGVLLGFPAPVVSTKVEVLESEDPFVIERSELVPNSGGAGRFRGGRGQSFVLRCVSKEPVYVLLRTERLRHPPKGVRGGLPALPGRVLLNGKVLRGKETFHMRDGDVLHLETPGGGGYGDPADRDPELAARDREDWPEECDQAQNGRSDEVSAAVSLPA
jgi:5-oxoprolinase (ATP-hydrolysing)/N-methylhydantoinase A